MFFQQIGLFLVLAQLDIEGNIVTKISKNPTMVLEEMRWQACQLEPSLSPSREPNGQICRRTGIYFCTCTTRHWGGHSRQISFESVKKFLRRCDNKINQSWPTAAMFVDGPEFFLVLAQLDTEGNSVQVLKNPTSGLVGDAITSNLYRRTVWRTPESSQTVTGANNI